MAQSLTIQVTQSPALSSLPLSGSAPSAAIVAAAPPPSPPPSDLAQLLTMQVTQSTGIPDSDTNPGPIAASGPGPQMSHEVVASVRPRQRKANVLNLNACICGLTITEHETEDNRVMRCQVPGCKTVWVSEASIHTIYNLY